MQAHVRYGKTLCLALAIAAMGCGMGDGGNRRKSADGDEIGSDLGESPKSGGSQNGGAKSGGSQNPSPSGTMTGNAASNPNPAAGVGVGNPGTGGADGAICAGNVCVQPDGTITGLDNVGGPIGGAGCGATSLSVQSSCSGMQSVSCNGTQCSSICCPNGKSVAGCAQNRCLTEAEACACAQ